ncbi:glycosyltransferase family 2 protein [Paenibacillus alkalitolerans]|uniref:glycosyltransferase family 2 protein n=1 Tax=Paenibacillus alkalitolerans TaxID=2799335 RepID=UPI0018F44834|nr:glycosyltransferase family 2 protein [Paenibacillus alkalitolerans]
MPTVSVHIVTYNSAMDIKGCIESVLSQSFVPTEIVVVDNASTDGTREKLTYYSNIRIVLNDTNNGFAGAHNQAIRMTDSDYLLVLNPDVTLHPDYLLHLIQFMQSNPMFGTATGLLLRKGLNEEVDSVGITVHKNRRVFDRGAGKHPTLYQESAEVFGVSGAAALYRRAMVKEISWNGQFFDEDFFAYKEDVDVSWRAQLLGWKAYYLSDALAFHERGWKEGTRFSRPLFVRRLSYVNRYKMILKNDSWGHLLIHLPYVLPYEIASLGYALLKDPKLLVAWGDFFKKISELLSKRMWIQQQRKVNYKDIYKFFV